MRCLLLCLVTAGLAACSSSGNRDANSPGDEVIGDVRDTAIQHEACDPAGKSARTFAAPDALFGSKPFVTRVYEGNRELCSFADLNGDGNVDVYTYLSPDGSIRRREVAYRVGKDIDEVALYKGNQLDLVLRETNLDGRIDTWDHYEGGKLVRRERDKTGDGRIDEWWTFEPGTENAVIVQADARTGKPDPSQTLRLGADTAGAVHPRPDAGAAEASTPATAARSASADAGSYGATDAHGEAGR